MDWPWIAMVVSTSIWCWLCLFCLHLWHKQQVLTTQDMTSLDSNFIFNALSEGLILIDKKNLKLAYLNKAAKIIDARPDDDLTSYLSKSTMHAVP